MSRTLLALHAHPDDESSKGAATMARYADQGVRVVVVTCTGGEAGEILNPAMDRPGVLEQMPELRRQELAKALEIIDVTAHHWLGYRDSGMAESETNGHPDAFANADLDEATGRLVALIRAERPQVVLTYDERGGYPHPDHIRTHEVSIEEGVQVRTKKKKKDVVVLAQINAFCRIVTGSSFSLMTGANKSLTFSFLS